MSYLVYAYMRGDESRDEDHRDLTADELPRVVADLLARGFDGVLAERADRVHGERLRKTVNTQDKDITQPQAGSSRKS